MRVSSLLSTLFFGAFLVSAQINYCYVEINNYLSGKMVV
jgi:hypothetical protein